MGHVAGRGRGDDPGAGRAQLLLVAAIGLAVLLVLLALALNTAVAGELQAAGAGDSLDAERAALGYVSAAERAVAGLLAPGYGGVASGNGTGYTDLRADLDDEVERWDDVAGDEYARDGAATNVTVTNVTFESRIVDDAGGTFESAAGAENWTLASDTPAVERYETSLEEAALVETDACATAGACFTLEIEGDSGAVWRLFAYSPTAGGVEVRVEPVDASETTCRTDDPSAAVNLTAGTFDPGGADCGFTTFTDELDPPYTVGYRDAGNATGTYDLLVDGTVVPDTIEADDRYDTTGSPRIEPRITSATVAARYQSPDLLYRAEFRVRGEAYA